MKNDQRLTARDKDQVTVQAKQLQEREGLIAERDYRLGVMQSIK